MRIDHKIWNGVYRLLNWLLICRRNYFAKQDSLVNTMMRTIDECGSL